MAPGVFIIDKEGIIQYHNKIPSTSISISNVTSIYRDGLPVGKVGVVIQEETSLLVTVGHHVKFRVKVFNCFDWTGDVSEAQERRCGSCDVSNARPNKFADQPKRQMLTNAEDKSLRYPASATRNTYMTLYSHVDRELVSFPKSPFSINTVLKPLVCASNAVPAPVAPPPTTSTSNSILF